MIYKKNKLLIDRLIIENLAKKFSTPLYCYSYKKLRENILIGCYLVYYVF